MIVRNEEAVLARCLESVRDAVDEIVIVDTGSSDRTKEIASEYTENIYDFEWIDDFSAARNFSFSKATCEYIMWLDADDVISRDNAAKLRELKNNLDGSDDVIMLPYEMAFGDDGKPSLRYYRERILKRSHGFLWEGAVHEVITPCGKISYAEIPIEHRPPEEKVHSVRNLLIYKKLLKDKKELSPRECYYFARELFDNGKYDDAAQRLYEFLKMPDAWIEDKKSAVILLSECLEKTKARKQQLSVLLEGCSLCAPWATLCCEIGKWYFGQKIYDTAAFWYESALRCRKTNYGFISDDYYGFIPCIWLCVCYDKLGDISNAKYWNERASEFHPNHPSIIYNRKYFENLS